VDQRTGQEARTRAGFVRWALVAAVLIGAASRIAHVDRPLDHRLVSPWREADYTQVARNFFRGDLNVLYPQIDWRGDTPGYVEMEFPLVPWLAALMGRITGYHEALVRLPSSIAAVIALFLFLRLSQRTLSPPGVLFAVAAFAVNPLLTSLATSMQPESAMLLLSLVAFMLIRSWDEQPRNSTLLGAAVAIAAATLIKSPAAHVGLVLGYVVIRRQRWRALTEPWNYAAAMVALLPPIAWYAWAAQFWLTYGNSLGVSNESHFIGFDMLFPPRFLLGNLQAETFRVFTIAGWLLAAIALVANRGRARLALIWYGAAWIFYIAAARTSGDNWASYYHSISVAPACLLMGAGVEALIDGRVAVRGLSGKWQRLAAILLALAALVQPLREAAGTIRGLRGKPDLLEMRRCVLQFTRHIAPEDLIVVAGASKFDEYGRPVAYNESMAFAWMDRKGFNYAAEDLGIATLERLAARGAAFWIARKRELEPADLARAAEARFRRVADCGGSYLLYDLRTPAGMPGRP
jgi:4-amino-4-deoxy-L-arabinose transferase-like glycosyltransferase